MLRLVRAELFPQGLNDLVADSDLIFLQFDPLLKSLDVRAGIVSLPADALVFLKGFGGDDDFSHAGIIARACAPSTGVKASNALW